MGAAEGRNFAIRTAAFCATLFFGLGISLPYMPLWLAARGLSATEIAAIVAAPLFLRVVLAQPLVHLAEKLPDLAVACVVYGAMAGIFLALMAFAHGYWPILALYALATVITTVLMSLSDAILLAGVRLHRVDYGRVRVWGSVGFVAGSFAGAAAIGWLGTPGVLPVLVAATFATAAMALFVPHVSAAGVVAEPYGIGRIFSDPVLRRALVAGNLILAAHGAYYVFGSLYWESQGFGEAAIGGLWAVSIVAEIAFFWWSKLFSGSGARRFLILGGTGAAVRWLLFPLATWPPAALLLQALHALTFAVTHLGVMMAIAAVAPRGHTARIQAAHVVLGGLLVACSTLLAGPLYKASPTGAFWMMAAFALPAIVLAWGLPRGLQPHNPGGGGSTRAPE